MTKAYIATAIPYVNGAPHVGHAMDYLIADVYRRFLLAQGEKVRFQAGTDEYGGKIFKKATAEGISAQQLVDQNTAKFKDFIHRLGVEYTDFVRTTDKDHIRRCQAIWQKLEPYIYKGTYEGWYCEGCEGFVTQTEYEQYGGICPDHQKPFIKLSEENYYLRTSDFKERVKVAIETDEMRIVPEFRKKEFINLLNDMADVSISRPVKQLSWGVPVPGDDTQVMYVWMDALTNYITVLGYPENDISDWWPAALQVVGKDIARFHIGIWPSILLGLGLPLPKTLVVHGHITVDGAKMSKSVGNVIDPIEILDKHGTEPFRYYFLRHVPTTEDADFSWDKFESAYNELANDLGNLAQRLSVMCQKYDITPQSSSAGQTSDNRYSKYDGLMRNFEFSLAFDYAWTQVQAINKAIDDSKPWEIAKSGDKAKLQLTINGLVKDLLFAAELLAPFLPSTSRQISDIFTSAKIVPPASPLFPKT